MPDRPASPARQELDEILASMVPTLDALDLSDAPAATYRLESDWPFDGPVMQRVFALCQVGIEEGWLAPREAGPQVRFGRLHKDLGGYAVDCVLMKGVALGHTHPRGEVTMAFGWEGEPRFDGYAPNWVVYPAGSHHVPTVTGGRMLFAYFLPGGEVVWDRPE